MLDRLIGFGKVLASSVSGALNAVLVNVRLIELTDDTEAPDTDAETSTEEVVYGGLGLIGRPDPPDAEGYAEVVALRAGDGAIPIGFRDLRLNRRMTPKDGELGLAHYGGAFLSLKWNDARDASDFTLLVPQLDGSGAIQASHTLAMTTASGDSAVVLAHLKRQALIMNDDGDAYLVSSDGKNIVGVTNEGVSIGGTINLTGGIIGGNPALAQPVALAPALAAFASAIPALMIALDAVLIAASAPAVTATSGITAAHYAAFLAARTLLDTTAAAVAAPVTGASQALKASPV